MDPIGGSYLVALLGVFTIFSFYFVFRKIFNEKAGLFAALLYTFSFYTIFNDREVVPTMPVILWSVWFLYGLQLLLLNKQRNAFILLGILSGLIWHLNVALVLVFPLVPLAILIARKKIDFRALLFGLVIFTVTMVPLLVFEVGVVRRRRHVGGAEEPLKNAFQRLFGGSQVRKGDQSHEPSVSQ